MFSVVRSRGGFNQNPTLIQSCAALHAITCNRLITTTSSKTNCERLDLDYLLPKVPEPVTPCPVPVEDIPAITDPTIPGWTCDLDAEPSSSIPLPVSDVPMDRDAYAYVAGYSIHRFIKCTSCQQSLLTSMIRRPFIKEKMYEGCILYDPIDALVDEVEKLKVKVFVFLEQVPHLDKIHEKLLDHPEISCLFHFSFIHIQCQPKVKYELLKNFCLFFIKVFCT